MIDTMLITGRTRLLLICIAVLVNAASICAQGAHTLQGRVVMPNGAQPNAPVKITLTYSGRRIYETFTDLSGRFNFPGIARGTYVLTAEGDGRSFETTQVTADVSAFGSAPQTFTQDVPLRPIAHKPITQPGVVNAFSQDVPAGAREAFQQGMKLADSGKIDEAVEKMRKAILTFPKYFDAHLQLGNLFLKTGHINDAISELDLAREINPNDERTYQSFGLLLMGQRNFPVAVAVFGEAARLNPSNPMNALMRGIALIHQATTIDEANALDRSSLLDRAEQSLNQALTLSDNKLKPDSPTLALLYEMKGDPERAAAELESYLRKAPQAKNGPTIKEEIKRLRNKAQATSARP